MIHELGRRGVYVAAADSDRLSAGKASRYVSRKVRLPVLRKEPGRYLDALKAELKSGGYDLLLPMFEESLLLSEFQSELRPHTRLFLPSFSMMYQLHHKPSLHQQCVTLGIPTPPIVLLNDEDSLSEVDRQIGYPAVLKLPTANNSVGRRYCQTESELRQNYRGLVQEHQHKSGEQPFAQKKIDADMVCSLAYALNGRKIAEVLYRTRRTFPEDGGTAAHKESIVHPEISQISEKLIAKHKWSGFLGLDFLLERKTGIPYVIDANPRSTPAIHLGFCSGLDWASIVMDLARDTIPATQTSRPGINVHTVLIDATWLLEGLEKGPRGWLNFPARFRDFLFPQWQVHSRDDLLTLGEWGSCAVIAYQAIQTRIRSLISGRQPGELLLAQSNYEPATVATYRQTLMANREERNAA